MIFVLELLMIPGAGFRVGQGKREPHRGKDHLHRRMLAAPFRRRGDGYAACRGFRAGDIQDLHHVNTVGACRGDLDKLPSHVGTGPVELSPDTYLQQEGDYP